MRALAKLVRAGRDVRATTGGCVAPHFGQIAGERFRS